MINDQQSKIIDQRTTQQSKIIDQQSAINNQILIINNQRSKFID